MSYGPGLSLVDAPVLLGAGLVLVFASGLYVWNSIALSKLFPKLGVVAWKAWIPVVKLMLIFEQGGVSKWYAALYYIPVLGIYGLYLKAAAVYRIGHHFGQSTGMAALGMLVPPVWALSVARNQSIPAENFGERIDDLISRMDVPKKRTEVTWPRIAVTPAPTLVRRVDHDPPTLARWHIVTDSGIQIDITEDRVVIGRQPVGVSIHEQLIVIADDTRTLSKSHVKLELCDGAWIATDLYSTNGIKVIERDGREWDLPAGGSALFLGRLLLGEVGLRLVVHEVVLPR